VKLLADLHISPRTVSFLRSLGDNGFGEVFVLRLSITTEKGAAPS
jgi:hypothetical protein